MVSDEELLEQIACGHEGSLEALIYRYHKPIYIYAQRMLNDRVAAEDLTQECFMRLCKTVAHGRLPSHFRPWLYRIATNLCRDVWKSSHYRRESLRDQNRLSHYSDHETVTSILERQWEREAVVQSLEDLQPEEKELIILRFYQELKLVEIAHIVQLPLSTVKSKLYKTFKKMAQLLQQAEVMDDVEAE